MRELPFEAQILSYDGNRWRGMIYGMTNRAGWAGLYPHFQENMRQSRKNKSIPPSEMLFLNIVNYPSAED